MSPWFRQARAALGRMRYHVFGGDHLLDLLERPEVQGIVRFDVQPAFSRRTYHRFVYMADVVVAAAFVHGHGLWECVPLTPGSSNVDLERIATSLSFRVPDFRRLIRSEYALDGPCPPEIAAWEQVRTLAEQAPSCQSATCDGIGYVHELHDRQTSVRAFWSNPRPLEHLAQIRLRDAYARLLARSNLTPKLVTDAFGIEDVPALHIFEPPPSPDDTEDELPEKKRSKPWSRRRR